MIQIQKPGYSWDILFLGAGGSMLANGFFMLLWPAVWFDILSGEILGFGSYNRLLLCEIGGFYLILGAVCIAAFWRKKLHLPAAVLLAAFYASQTLLQIAEMLHGNSQFEHWLIYMPFVHLPVLISFAITLMAGPNLSEPGCS